MSFPRVSPGDRLRIPADAWNASLDAAEAFQRNGLRGRDLRPAGFAGDVLEIKNDSNVTLEPYQLAHVTLEDQTMQGFRAGAVRWDEAPQESDPISETDDALLWALTLEQIDAGQAGRATMSATLIVPIMEVMDSVGDRLRMMGEVLYRDWAGPIQVIAALGDRALARIGVPEARRRARIESSVELPEPNQWSYGVRAPGGFDAGATNRWEKINGSSGVQGIGLDLDADAPGGSSLELLPAPDGLEVEVLSRWEPVSGEVLHEFQFPNAVKATCL